MSSTLSYNGYQILSRNDAVDVFDPRGERGAALYSTTSLDKAMRWVDAFRDGATWAALEARKNAPNPPLSAARILVAAVSEMIGSSPRTRKAYTSEQRAQFAAECFRYVAAPADLHEVHLLIEAMELRDQRPGREAHYQALAALEAAIARLNAEVC